MTDKAWKRTERKIADRLGGERQPISGREGADILHPWLAIECKHRASFPDWLWEAIRQAVASANPSQLPIAVLHEKNRRHGNDLVVLRLRDFEDWFGSGKQLELAMLKEAG